MQCEASGARRNRGPMRESADARLDRGQSVAGRNRTGSRGIGGREVAAMPKMKAAIFVEPGRIVLDEKPVPDLGPLDALIRVTTTTICGTDVHILKGEYPVAKGLTIGHEPVGVIEKLGSAVSGFREGQRVIAGAITPSGHSAACLCGCAARTAPDTKHGWKADRAAGGSATRSTAARRNTCWCRTRWPISPGAGRADRRAGADVPGHHVHRLLRRRERRHPDRRHGGGVRAGADRAVRHGRREARGCHDRHRRGRDRRRGWRWRAQVGADHVVELPRGAIRSRRSCA